MTYSREASKTQCIYLRFFSCLQPFQLQAGPYLTKLSKVLSLPCLFVDKVLNLVAQGGLKFTESSFSFLQRVPPLSKKLNSIS